MTVRVVSLQSREASAPPSAAAEERLLVLQALSDDAWRLTGRRLPVASRATLRVVLRRLHEPRS